MRAELETLEGIDRRIRMVLPMAPIQADVDRELKSISKRVRVDGFRPGKAPMRMVAQQYGSGVRYEVIEKHINRSFSEAVRMHELSPVGFPQFEEIKEEGDQLLISAFFEIYPDVEIGDLSTYEIHKPTLEVGDAEVNKTLDILRKQRTSYTQVSRPANIDDRVIIDFLGTVDNVPFAGGSAENFPFVLGANQMLPDFEAGVIGMSEGDEKDVTVVFPEDYHGKEIAGKTAQFHLKMKAVSEPIIPELTEDFAKQLGVKDGTVETLKQEIRDNLVREVRRRLNDRLKRQVFDILKKTSSLQVPKAFLAQENERMVKEMRQRLTAQGIKDADMAPIDASMFSAQAKDRVTLGIVLNHLIEKNQLSPQPDQVRALIEEWSQSYEDPKEMIDWFYGSPERLQEPEGMVSEQNVVDYVLSQAKVIETPIDFDTLMENA